MLVQDSLTGYLHEVPDQQLYEFDPYLGEAPDYQLYEADPIFYDGFGNPVGLPFLAPVAAALAPMAAKALPAIASRVLPAAARALPGIVRGVTGAARSIIPAATRAITGAVRTIAPAAAGAVQTALAPTSGLIPVTPPMPFAPTMPPGWTRPTIPYTGMGPRRVYMRCAVWPGPRGLVPASAASMLPAQVMPVPQAPAGAMRRRPRLRRRR